MSFWLPPFLISRLGIDAFGMIPLSTALISYAGLITIAVNGSLSRFLSLDLANDNHKQANITFNTAFVSLLALVAILVPLLGIFSFNVASFLSIPTHIVQEGIVLFICTSIAFLVSTFTSLFNTSAYLANRLDLVNRVTVINTFIRVGLILIIFLFVKVSLGLYGISMVIASLLAGIYSYILFAKYTPYLSLNTKLFDKSILQNLLSMGGWLVVIQLGNILFLQIDLLLINTMIGSAEAGKYGALLQWSNMIRTLSITLSGALGPLILKLYSMNKIEELIKLSKLSTKILSLSIAVIVSVLCLVSTQFLTLWIGPSFSQYGELFNLMLISLPINLGILPLFSINRAYNKLRIPGLFTCFMGLVNLILAYCLVRFTDMGLYGIVIASIVVLTVKNFIFIPIYVAKQMKINIGTFYASSIPSILSMLAILLIGKFYLSYFTIQDWPGLMSHSAILLTVGAMISFVLLKGTEKKLILDIVAKKSV
ncbi:hypothetical protein ASG33_09890 [Dyadobacter sp. Leaf189]|nr:hypothetical protein ASG33_09890 [Dyadobacter sp. Leaf189]